MSVQFFNGVGGSDLEMFNGTSGASYTGNAVIWGAKIACPVSDQNGGVRTQVLKGASPGANLVTAINNATDVVQAILNKSKGYLVNFSVQCGLYRHDKLGVPVPPNKLLYGYVDITNVVDGTGQTVSAQKSKSQRVYFPFVSTKDLGELESTVQALMTAGKICALNFHDEDKDSFDVTPMTGMAGIGRIQEYTRKELALLASNDTSSGGSDGVLRSERS